MVDARAIADWMQAQVDSAGKTGIVLGLSGGIDSAVAAALACMAVGDKAVGVLMPCDSLPADADHALVLARHLNLDTEYVDLANAYDALKAELPTGTDLADANLKPRLRMTTLYHIAQARDSLVCGTGNRSELAVGYFTKWGDGGCDMLPLGNMLKVEVRELAEYLDIPEEIIAKPPSAGLWEGQTDEEEMGFTYAELDHVVAKAAGEDFDPQTKTEKLITAMMNGSEHKRARPPVYRDEGGDF